MFRTYRSILGSVYKLCVAGLVCEDCVLLGASIRLEVVEVPSFHTSSTQFIDAPEDGPVGPKHVELSNILCINIHP